NRQRSGRQTARQPPIRKPHHGTFSGHGGGAGFAKGALTGTGVPACATSLAVMTTRSSEFGWRSDILRRAGHDGPINAAYLKAHGFTSMTKGSREVRREEAERRFARRGA